MLECEEHFFLEANRTGLSWMRPRMQLAKTKKVSLIDNMTSMGVIMYLSAWMGGADVGLKSN